MYNFTLGVYALFLLINRLLYTSSRFTLDCSLPLTLLNLNQHYKAVLVISYGVSAIYACPVGATPSTLALFRLCVSCLSASRVLLRCVLV